METKCENCKHWGADGEIGWEAAQVGFNRCCGVRERWIIQDEASPRRNDKQWIEARKEALRAARAYVQDGSEYTAELVTSADFSCALFISATQ